MLSYVFRRVVGSVFLIIGLLTFLFFVVRLAPGDPFARFEAADIDPAYIEQMRRTYGLDQPLGLQYVQWVRSFLLQGDFGVSLTANRPVSDLLAESLPNTLRLGALALLLRMAVGVALGVLSAVRQGGWLDRGITLTALVIYSMPSFWLALMLLLVFAFQLQWLPAGQMQSLDHATLPWFERSWDAVSHMLLPVFVLGIGGAASTARFMRASLLEVLSQDYVRTARAKGLREARVVLKHALRNALLPIVTLLGLSIPSLVGGAIVVEFVFGWPGMGRLTMDALVQRDYPIIMATTFLSAVMVVLGNLVADVLYSMLDPRIRLEGRT